MNKGVMQKIYLGALLLVLALIGCTPSGPVYVVITSTPSPEAIEPSQEPLIIIEVPEQTPTPSATSVVPPSQPTPNPTRVMLQNANAGGREYVVQPGDTFNLIAERNGVSPNDLQALNNLANVDLLSVGQVLQLPELPDVSASDFKIIPDSLLVRGPGSSTFDIAAFVALQPGYIRVASDEVNEVRLSAAQIVERVSLEYSVHPKLLLALLEYRSGWLSDLNPLESLITRPLGAEDSIYGFSRTGLYRQLAWAADQLNAGYYGWKYGNLETLSFEDGTRLRFASSLNPGTIGLQHVLSLYNTYGLWQHQVSADGFYQTYFRLFGDPFTSGIDSVVPVGLEQPMLTLPFQPGEIWFYSGGHHGGWGTGSAWSAIDFAPPDDLSQVTSSCYLSQHWVTAVADGVISRTGEGLVILDLDGDYDESTGWSILYLHLDQEGRIAEGTPVSQGDRLGRPSCEGGVSNGTHVHIARRYNGEWIPADCSQCRPEVMQPSFVLGGWEVVGLAGQEYQGYLVRPGEERRTAEQGRLLPINLVSW
jgi:LasA protease